MSDPADLSREAIAAALADHQIGSRLIVLLTVDSTMDEVRRLAADGAPHGTALIADHQRQGRGRLGRRWVEEAGTSLLLSVLLKCRRPGVALAQAPMAVALATLQGIETVSSLAKGQGFGMKWPNDLVAAASGAKLGGLLAEAVSRSDGHDVVVGIGVNVRQGSRQLPPGATSLAAEGVTVGRGTLASAILDALGDYWRRLDSGEDLVAEWRGRLVTLGRDVVAVSGQRRIRGRALDVSADGALVLETASGKRVEVLAGDVTLDAPVAPTATAHPTCGGRRGRPS